MDDEELEQYHREQSLLKDEIKSYEIVHPNKDRMHIPTYDPERISYARLLPSIGNLKINFVQSENKTTDL